MLKIILLTVLYTLQSSQEKNIHQHPINLDQILPPKEELLNSLKKHYQIATKKALEQVKPIQPTYLPSITLNLLTFIPSIKLNTTSIFKTIYNKTIQKQQQTLIKIRLEEKFQKDIQKINLLLQELQQNIETYNQELEIHQIHQTIFSITQTQYEKLEILPSQHLKAQIKLKKETLKLNKSHAMIKKTKENILIIVKMKL